MKQTEQVNCHESLKFRCSPSTELYHLCSLSLSITISVCVVGNLFLEFIYPCFLDSNILVLLPFKNDSKLPGGPLLRAKGGIR